MDYKIEIWPIEKLVFYARNPRKNDAVVDRMCSSIRQQLNPRPNGGKPVQPFGLRAKRNPSYERKPVTTNAITLAHTGMETPCTTTGVPKTIRSKCARAIRRNTIPAISEYA